MSDDPEADIHEFPRTRPRVKKLRLFFVLCGLGMLALVSTAFGMMMAVAADLDELESRPTSARRARNSVLVDVHGKAARRPAQPGQPDPRRRRPDLAGA